MLAHAEVPTPVPNHGELCVRIIASAITAADAMMRRGTPRYARLFLGVRRPKAKTPGTGFAGVVTAVGPGVTSYSVGDEVLGEAGTRFGAHAEYVCVPETGVLLHKPAHLSFDEACTLCDGPLTSYNFLVRMANVRRGSRILVIGAAGALGSAAVQIGKALGATVTGVCSQKNTEFVLGLGANHVIDYTREDYCKRVGQYDVIYDAVGASSFGKTRRALSAHGQYLSPVLSMGLLANMLWTRLASRQGAQFDATGLRKPDELRTFLTELLALAESGALRQTISQRYSLDELRRAHALLDTGHKRGNIVLAISEP